MLLTKPSSDVDSGFWHGFGAEASLPLAQSAPAVSHDTTRLCLIVVALWDCLIYADAVRALSWIFSMYLSLSLGGSPRFVEKVEVELAIKPLHPTLIGNTFVIKPLLIHCSCRSSYFSNLRWCAPSKFSSKGTVNSITNTFFALPDQMTISGRFVGSAISDGNMKFEIGCDVPVHAAYIYIYIYTEGMEYVMDDERCWRSKKINTPESIGQRVWVRVTMLRFEGSPGRDSVWRGQHSSNQVSGISSRTMHQYTTPSLSQTIWPRWS